MKCTTLSPKAKVTHGILVQKDDQAGACILVGGQPVPVSRTIRDTLDIMLGKMAEALESSAEELDESELQMLRDAISSQSMYLMEADVEPDGRVCKSDGKRRDAFGLVHVALDPGPRQELHYTSQVFSENQTHPRAQVERTYENFPPVGVTVLAENNGQALIAMAPRSSFRIEVVLADSDRDPHRSYTVRWTGSNLRCREYLSGRQPEESSKTAAA